VNAGSSPVDWIQDVVKNLKIETIFQGAIDLQLLKKVYLTSLGIFFSAGSAPPTASSVASADFSMPWNFPISVKKIIFSSFFFLY